MTITGILSALMESELSVGEAADDLERLSSAAVRAAREECARAICKYCGHHRQEVQFVPGTRPFHRKADGSMEYCWASAIWELIHREEQEGGQ